MTPSNPNNDQPFIYRIADVAGVFHLVAPVDHTHTYAEVPGLADDISEIWVSLGEKANSDDVTNALAGKANAIPAGSPSGGIVIANTAGELSRSPKTVKDLQDAIAAKQNALTFDTTPTEGSTNPVTSGGVKAAIDALTTSVVPIHQVAAILPKTTGYESEYESLSWLGDGKMALVLQTARPVEVNIEATGVDDAPDGTWIGSTDISFDLAQGIRTVKNIYDLMYAQLQHDYPGERIGVIENWKICVYAKDTVSADTACLINFYNPTSAE